VAKKSGRNRVCVATRAAASEQNPLPGTGESGSHGSPSGGAESSKLLT